MPSHFHHRSPKSSRKKIISLAVAAIAAQGALGGALLRPLPLWAQEVAQDAPVAETQAAPELEAVRGTNEAQTQELWKQLQEHSAEMEATDARSAIALYQKFFEQGAGRFPSVGVKIALRIARLWQIDLKDYDKAIEIYDWALGLYRNRPEAVQLQQGRLAAEQTQKRAEAAQGGKTPSASPGPGGAPLVVPVPRSPNGGSLGVSVGVPAVGNSQPLLATAPVTRGNALGWQPGADRCVTAMAQQQRGALWVATEDAGVWVYSPSVTQVQDRWHQFTAKDGLGDDSAYALAVDKQNRVWAGTQSHGVSVWNGEKWKNYSVLDGPLGERVFAIKVCPTDGDVWIATNVGLSRYSSKNDSWSYITRAEGLPSDQVQALSFDKDGNIIVGTQCDGVALAQAKDGYKTWRQVKGPEQMPVTPTGKGLPSSLTNAVLVARDGTFYVGTTMGLAWSRDNGQSWAYARGQDYAAKVKGRYKGAPATWKEEPGAVLAEDYVSCLAQDEEGRLWIGHLRAGDEVLETQNGSDVSLKRVTQQENSGLVRAILPIPNASPLIARYDEGISSSLLSSAHAKTIRSLMPGEKGGSTISSVFSMGTQASAPALPSPATPPLVEELRALTHQVESLKQPLEPVSAAYIGDDWITRGDWLGRYGSRYALLCAMQSPLDHTVVNDIGYEVKGRQGWNSTIDDSLRLWLHRERWDDPRVLYDPQIGYRREAEWDDHGEAYPFEHEGPDIWVGVHVPAGVHRVSLYFFNKDGHQQDNRTRDYVVEVRKGIENFGEADSLPVLARARVRDFWGGVYKTFVVHGAGDYFFTVRRNNTFNAILQGVFTDKLSGPPSIDETNRSAWLGDVTYRAPFPEELNAIQKAALSAVSPQNRAQLEAAIQLWTTVGGSSEKIGVEAFALSGQVMAYRAVQAATRGTSEGEALLKAWRWTLPLWSQQERGEFEEAMKRGFEANLRFNPELRNIKH